MKENVQRCSGNGCVKAKECLHYVEGKKKTKVKGRWVTVYKCLDENFSEFKETK